MYHIQFQNYTLEGPSWVAVAAVMISIYLMQSIAYVGIFKKAGEKKWKGFVPFLNAYSQFKISWSKAAFWIFLIVLAIRVSAQFTIPYITMIPYLEYIKQGSSTILAIISIVALYKLSTVFGHGIGFTIGLVFLTQIFMLIIGLGNSEYTGKRKKEKKAKKEKTIKEDINKGVEKEPEVSSDGKD